MRLGDGSLICVVSRHEKMDSTAAAECFFDSSGSSLQRTASTQPLRKVSADIRLSAVVFTLLTQTTAAK